MRARTAGGSMILSFSNNLAFVKTRKTAGTSVEIVLSTWCEAGDVRSSTMNEELREAYGGLPPVDSFRGHPLARHMSATDMRALDPAFWEGAYSFAVERHPYEKAVSRAYWDMWVAGATDPADFPRFLERVLDESLFVDNALYMRDGRLLVTEVVLFDDLWDHLARLAELLGKRLPRDLPRAKGFQRQDRRPAADILSDAQKRRICELAHVEMATFGFDPCL